jgi:hypothetical protein
MRLIDSDELRAEWLHNGKNEPVYTANDFLGSIDSQPTISTGTERILPMKVPESVRIGGIEYHIEYVPNLRDGVDLLCGQISYNDCIIRLSDTDRASKQSRLITMWHEILHGIREHSCMEIKDEEAIVDMFAKGIVQILNDNFTRFFEVQNYDGV